MKTQIEEMLVANEAEVCCAILDPHLWNNKIHIWENELFLKESIPEFFHIPLPTTYGKAIARMWKKAKDASAMPDSKDFLILTHDSSPFKGDLLMAITKEIPNEEVVRLSGTFISKVFDGPYSSVPNFVEEMNTYLASQKRNAKNYYFYYAYCPKCSKKYGHNYVVVFAEV